MADKCDPFRSGLANLEHQLAGIRKFITDEPGGSGGPVGKPHLNPDWVEVNGLVSKARIALKACVDSLGPPVQPTQLPAAQAAESIKRGWGQFGGPRSFLGLPVGSQIEVANVGGQFRSQFRSGDLHLSSDGTKVVSLSHDEVTITLVGIECQIRQESEDEIYGVVTAFGPSGSTIITKRFPASGTLTFGPTGLRINNINLVILENGIVQNYTIMASLIENDSGDVDDIAKKLSDKIAKLVGEGVGALTGAPAEAVTDSESFKEGIDVGTKFFLGSVVGIGDDPYNPESFSVHWTALRAATPLPFQPSVHRDDDPRTIEEWTHRIILSGRDDGGDVGQYALYFQIKSRTHEIKETVRV